MRSLAMFVIFICYYLSLRHVVITGRRILKSVTLLTPAKYKIFTKFFENSWNFFTKFNFDDPRHGCFILLF